MVRNPKSNLNLEFRGPNTVEERGRCAEGFAWPKAMPWPPRGEPMGPTARAALWSHGPHAPHMGSVMWPLLIRLKLPSLKSF